MPRVAGGALAALLLTAVARAQKGVGTQEISYRVADLNRCAKTVSGHRCQAWGENDFGLDPNFRRCAKVDGLDKPWCYWGENDEWDYCDEACHRPEGEEQDDDKCRRTTAGNKCEAWGENDFGLDPDSKECAKVDGLDKPWCYWGENDEWDYCDESCDKAAQQKEEQTTPEKKPAQTGKTCSRTVSGQACDAWGENDFGLSPDSKECAQVDGLDKPWCYTSGDDWDYCDCSGDTDDDDLTVSPEAPDEEDEATKKEREKQRKYFEEKRKEAEAQVAAEAKGNVGQSKPGSEGWEETDEVDEDGNPLQKMDMKSLMLQGKVSRWWWDSQWEGKSQRLTDADFDSTIANWDYYALMFFGPGCEHCKELQQDYIKMADSFTKRRNDIAFGHVNCAHGDQTFRAPTEEELEEGDATAWGEYYDEGGNALEGAKDGEVVCKWYKVTRTPLIVLFNPNNPRPKALDAPRTLTGITGWIEDEIKTNNEQLGRDETHGLTSVGLAAAGMPELEAGCDDVRAANKALREDIEQYKENKIDLDAQIAELKQQLADLS